MATLEGCWGVEGAIADWTYEEMDELVHGRAGILGNRGLFKESSRDQEPQSYVITDLPPS